MDFLKKNFELAQQQATEAAAKARIIAKQVSDKSQVLAQQAGHNAALLAHQVTESTQELAQKVTVKTKEIAEQAKTTANNLANEDAKEVLGKLGLGLGNSETEEPAEAQYSKESMEAMGINEDFLIFLSGLTYSTFRDCSGSPEADDKGFIEIGDGKSKLNPWQERHANLVLHTVKELQDLRYLLCPKRMEEERFWKIYFSLAHPHLPEACISGELVPEEKPVSPSTNEDGSAPPLVGKYTFVQADKDSGKGEGSHAPKSAEDTDKDDELDVYLENVLREGDEVEGSDLEDFEDFDEYMEQLKDDFGPGEIPEESGSIEEKSSEPQKA